MLSTTLSGLVQVRYQVPVPISIFVYIDVIVPQVDMKLTC